MGYKKEGTMIKRRLISCLNNSCTSVYVKEDVENFQHSVVSLRAGELCSSLHWPDLSSNALTLLLQLPVFLALNKWCLSSL